MLHEPQSAPRTIFQEITAPRRALFLVLSPCSLLLGRGPPAGFVFHAITLVSLTYRLLRLLLLLILMLLLLLLLVLVLLVLLLLELVFLGIRYRIAARSRTTFSRI